MACPVCSSKNRKSIFKIPFSEVKVCSECGLKYLDPCLSPKAMQLAYEDENSLIEFNSHHEGYYGYGNINEPSQTLSEFTRELDLLESLIPAMGKRSLLDVGFGNGFFLAVAKKRGWLIQGVDTSQHNVELAKKKFGLDLIHGALEDLKSAEPFDAISFLDVIEHLPSPDSVLQVARRHLKPGGHLLIAVPNDDSFFGRLSGFLYQITGGMFNKGIRKIYLLEHVCYYNESTLTKMVENQGFVKRGSFLSNTDLDKYSLPLLDRWAGKLILFLSEIFRKQNRLIAVFQKK